ncbi:MAG TPA: MFS transporter [Hyphomicrobiaceae bacterium]|nr:MFS transporter [Hyphomicrobiaceae bacterium]
MQDHPEQSPSTSSLFFSVFPSVMLPMFLAVVDQTIVSTALPAIAANLGGVERVSWVVVAYLVAGTIAAPVYGQLRDVYGGKPVMFLALGVFLVGSILCAVSVNVEMLALCRVLQGLGGGGLMTLSQALIGETVPPRERARYQGYLAGVMVTSSAFGPVVGGILTQYLGWRSVFLVNLPLVVIAGLLTLRVAYRLPRKRRWSFDVAGLALFVAFIIPVLLALEQVQRMQGNALATFALLMSIGLVALYALVQSERHAAYPLLPISLLRQPTIWRSDALAAAHGATLVSLIAFLPIYMRVVHGTSASKTGLLLLPLTFGIGTGSMLTGRIVSRTGFTAIFPSIGLILATGMLLALTLLSNVLGLYTLAVMLFFTGLFMGTVMGVVQVTVQNAVGAESLGSAAASVQLSRSIGAVGGTALVGTVLFAALALGDPQTAPLFEALLGRGTLADPSLLASARLRAEIGAAFQAAFLTIAAFAATGMVLAWWIPARRL